MKFRHWFGSIDEEKQAQQELDRSRQLLEETRAKVAPLKEAYEHNQFSDIIREALGLGWEQGKRNA